MNSKRSYLRWMIPFTLVLSLVFISSCEQESPVASQESKNPVTIFKVMGGDLNKLFTAEQWIGEDGGTVIVGDEQEGYCELVFPEDALDGNVRITVHWLSESLLQADFGPAGTTFNQPVYISLSYKSADLSNVPDENDLGIYYYNSVNGTWELISNNVNTEGKYVEGYINHFSRYAIGME